MLKEINRPVKRKQTIIPPEMQINQIWEYQIARPGHKGETKRNLLECLFLLCWKAGLRVSEAIIFDLKMEHPDQDKKGLFAIRGKGQKDRWTYLSPELVKELKKRSWKPNSISRISFFLFLQNLKELNELPIRIELTPHTLRRIFATSNVLKGMPLPVMQKFLGHSKISTTALYVKDCELEHLLKYRPGQ